MPYKGAACIQGNIDNEITPELVMQIGQTVGTQYKNVTVGRNLRPNSMMVFSSLVAGLNSTGANVRDAGPLPLPVLPFASRDTDCCIMIGNPDDKECIGGLSFCNTDGRYFNEPQMFALSNRFDSEKILSNYKHVGNIKKITGSIESYRRKVTEVSVKADCQVILDCSSDSTILVAPQVLTDIGAEPITVNCHIDWKNNEWKPTPEEIDLKIMSKVVKANYGSIGIALNGDGSRIAAIDEEGRYISGEKLLELFVSYLKPKTIAIPADTSMAVKDLMQGTIVITKVGSARIGEAIKINDLEMGGCNDGSFIFPKISCATDGMAAAALLSRIATEGSLSDLVDELPTYYRNVDSVRYSNDRESIAKRISMKVGDIGYDRIYEIDGWRIEKEDGWFLIRFSDDAPVIDIIAEGRDKIYSAGLLEVAKEVVVSSLKSVNI